MEGNQTRSRAGPARKHRSTPRPPTEKETPRQRFLRIFPKRLTTAVKAIELLAYAGDRTYEMLPEDANKIIGTLEREVQNVKTALLTKGGRMKAPVAHFRE